MLICFKIHFNIYGTTFNTHIQKYKINYRNITQIFVSHYCGYDDYSPAEPPLTKVRLISHEAMCQLSENGWMLLGRGWRWG